MITNLLVVGAGGALGSMLRYALQSRFNSLHFPYGTLAVNITGCFLAGIVAGVFLKTVPPTQLSLFAITGFCGGFTTFSAFTLESIHLIDQGKILSVCVYLATSIFGGLLAAFFGLKITI